MLAVAECDANELNNLEEENDWLRTSVDCPYFDNMTTDVVNNTNSNKRKAHYSNKGGNKRFKRSKTKKYVLFYSIVELVNITLLFLKNYLFK